MILKGLVMLDLLVVDHLKEERNRFAACQCLRYQMFEIESNDLKMWTQLFF